MWSLPSNSEKETKKIAEKLASYLWPGAVIALTGDLGAGKTVFAKGLARGLAVKQTVTSPTFTLIQVYEGGKLPFYHVDAYRLESREDAWGIGLEEFLEGEGVCLVEWAENIQELLPADYLEVLLEKLEEGRRKLTFNAHGETAREALRKFGGEFGAIL